MSRVKLLIIHFLFLLQLHGFASEKYPGTRFGTFASFRQFSGSPNFTDGHVYQDVDGSKYYKNQVYRFIGPDGKPVFQSDDRRELIGKQPDSATEEWWIFQLRQMIEAGFDFVALDCFGEVKPRDCVKCARCKVEVNYCPNNPEFKAAALKLLFKKYDLPIKVGLFVDTPGPYLMYNWDRLKGTYGNTDEWCKYIYFKPGQGKDPRHVIGPMPMTPENVLEYYYKRVIWPFFSGLDDSGSRKHWLTDTGLSPEQGGRPIIWIYAPNKFDISSFEKAGYAFQSLKEKFQKDFGITPFLVIENQWFKLSENDERLLMVADAKESFIGDWMYGSKNPPASNTWKFKNFTISRVLPGIKAPPGHWGPQNGILDKISGERWKYVDGTTGDDEGYFLKREWEMAAPQKPNLMIFGFWDDNEGDSLAKMSDYARETGGFLEPDFYIKRVRALIDGYKKGE